MSGTQFLKGLAIILVGVILLLNNLNILSWSVWYHIFRLWPLLLVSLGISLIFRRRLSWLAPLVILVGIVIGASASYMGVDLHLEGRIVTESQTFQRELNMVPVVKQLEPEAKNEVPAEEIITDPTSNTEIENEQEQTEEAVLEETLLVSEVQKAIVRLNYDIGIFELQFPTPLVYQCLVNYRYPAFKPIEEYSISERQANIHIYHQQIADTNLHNTKNRIELKLNKEIIYDIFIETGATSINYDLSKFKIEQCSVKSGVSDIRIVAPEYNCDINIDSGVSKIDIALPTNAGSMIRLNTGLSMKNLGKEFREKENKNNVYISNNYEQSKYQVNINIDSGLSQINIHYI